MKNKSKDKGRMEKMEGATTKAIEKVTSEIPSGAFLMLAGGAIAGSLILKLTGRSSTANFVGEWVPTILMLGLYNKIVKVLGSERSEVRETVGGEAGELFGSGDTGEVLGH